MRASHLAITALGAAMLACGWAAPSTARDSDPATTAQCLEPSGALRGPVCRRGSVWRQDDICRCPDATVQVTAPYCDKDEVPASQSRAANRARYEAARDGSLVGDSFEGKRFCVRPQRVPG